MEEISQLKSVARVDMMLLLRFENPKRQGYTVVQLDERQRAREKQMV